MSGAHIHPRIGACQGGGDGGRYQIENNDSANEPVKSFDSACRIQRVKKIDSTEAAPILPKLQVHWLQRHGTRMVGPGGKWAIRRVWSLAKGSHAGNIGKCRSSRIRKRQESPTFDRPDASQVLKVRCPILSGNQETATAVAHGHAGDDNCAGRRRYRKPHRRKCRRWRAVDPHGERLGSGQSLENSEFDRLG